MAKSKAIQPDDNTYADRQGDTEISGSWLSLNIRPMLAIAITLDYLLTKYLYAFGKSAITTLIVDKTYHLMEWIMAFYLGFKGLERIAQHTRSIIRK
jgi:hypothetical protein